MGADPVVTRVVEIVSQKTGYPPDLLDLDLDLEADLGVDTVKQAETFAAVRAEWSIPRQENLKLRDFPTLRHVVGFVRTHRPDLNVATVPAAQAPLTPTPLTPTLSPRGAGGEGGQEAAPAARALFTPRSTGEAAPTAAAPLQPPSTGTDPVTTRVVEIVSQKTGYPPDLLDLDLDLEADLGVDTVKQAETFAAVRAEWSIPRQESLKLRDFPTLRHVIGFVRTHRPDLDVATVPAAEAPLAPSPLTPTLSPRSAGREGVREPAGGEGVKEPAAAAGGEGAQEAPAAVALEARPLTDADRVPRRVATPVLRPPLELCKPTGVKLGAGARVVVARGARDGVVAQKLVELGATVLVLDARQPAETIAATLRGWRANGPIHGVFWLPALEPEVGLDAASTEDFRERTRVVAKNLATAMRVLYESVAAQGTFLVAATRLGGLLGLGDDGTDAPLGGAVQGFVKAYKRERPAALVKVVDFAGDATDAEIADALVAEALGDPGVVEVGRRAGVRWSIGLEARPVSPSPSIRLDEETVFVVTGAAGGITSAIVADLAAASGGTFHLLDLVAPPAADDPHVALFRAGRERLKEALIAEAKARGEKPTPVAIDRQLMTVERQEAALRALESVERAGGKVCWHAVDLLDAASVEAAVAAIGATSGRIDVLVHAGGLEISRALADKPDDEWARVFDVKADGFFSLLRATRDLPLGAAVVFSSVAGRFGNSGQTDYSAANALLCAMTRWLRRARPGTRGIAIDWSAWGGIGMATRGSIPKIMEAAGIDLLAPEVGIPTVRRELLSGASDELVVGGRLGVLCDEWDATGGLDVERARARLAGRGLTMVGEVKGAPLYGPLVVETRLDPTRQPFLLDHRIDGVPVLPGVMGMEAFAEVASLLCPDRVVTGVCDVEFLLPFKFHRMQAATLHLAAVGRPGAGDAVLVDVQLSSRLQPKPGLPPQERLHFRGRVVLERAPLAAKTVAFRRPAEVTFHEGRIYRVYFHGPAYQVLDGVRLEEDHAVGVMRAALPPNAADVGAAALAAPRLVELCFQTAGVLEIARREVFGLPAALESVRIWRAVEIGRGGLFAEVRQREDDDGFDARVVDADGNVHVELSGYRTVAIPEPPESMSELLEPTEEGAPA
jgi:NAD(P)-dependent dehydrogenase (short-subunit alcohol dehydrogenase family)